METTQEELDAIFGMGGATPPTAPVTTVTATATTASGTPVVTATATAPAAPTSAPVPPTTPPAAPAAPVPPVPPTAPPPAPPVVPPAAPAAPAPAAPATPAAGGNPPPPPTQPATQGPSRTKSFALGVLAAILLFALVIGLVYYSGSKRGLWGFYVNLTTKPTSQPASQPAEPKVDPAAKKEPAKDNGDDLYKKSIAKILDPNAPAPKPVSHPLEFEIKIPRLAEHENRLWVMGMTPVQNHFRVNQTTVLAPNGRLFVTGILPPPPPYKTTGHFKYEHKEKTGGLFGESKSEEESFTFGTVSPNQSVEMVWIKGLKYRPQFSKKEIEDKIVKETIIIDTDENGKKIAPIYVYGFSGLPHYKVEGEVEQLDYAKDPKGVPIPGSKPERDTIVSGYFCAMNCPPTEAHVRILENPNLIARRLLETLRKS